MNGNPIAWLEQEILSLPPPREVSTRTYATIVAMNLIPAVGVIAWGWSILVLLGFYLVELLFVGVANLVKVYLSGRYDEVDETVAVVVRTAKSYGLQWLIYVAFVGVLIGIIYLEQSLADEPMVPGVDSQLADHPFFVIDAGVGPLALVFGAAMVVWLVEQFVDVVVDRAYIERTMQQQRDAVSASFEIPMIAGGVALFAFFQFQNPILSVIVLTVGKIGLEVQHVRGRRWSDLVP